MRIDNAEMSTRTRVILRTSFLLRCREFTMSASKVRYQAVIIASIALHFLAAARTRRDLCGAAAQPGRQHLRFGSQSEPGVGVDWHVLRPWAWNSKPGARRESRMLRPRRRETLQSERRAILTSGLQPYMLGGLTLLRADDPEFRASRRRRAISGVSPALDGDRPARQRRGSTMIVRPTAAIIYSS